MGDLREALERRGVELERRIQENKDAPPVLRDGDAAQAKLARDGKALRPQADQAVVVYSLSQTGFAPCRPPDGDAAVRLLGAFATLEEAREHAERVQAELPDVSLLMARAHEWVLAAETPERLADAEAVGATIDAALARYAKQRAQTDAAFRRQWDARKDEAEYTRALNDSDSDDDDAKTPATTTSPAETRRGRKMSAALQVCNQRLAVVCFVVDTCSSEFLFKVLACVDTMAEAQAYCERAASSVGEVDMHVVSMYEWLWPATHLAAARDDGDADAAAGVEVADERYRHRELDHIMRRHRQSTSEVRDYRRKREQEEEEDEADRGLIV